VETTSRLRRLWRPVLVGLALALLLISLGLDIYRQSTATAGVTSPRPYGPPNAQFDAELDVTVKKIDRRRQQATADVRVEIWNKAPYVSDANRVRSAILLMDSGDSRVVLRAQSKFVQQDWVKSSRCGVSSEAPLIPVFWEETRDLNGPYSRAHVSHTFCDVKIAIQATSALVYPFDSAQIAIAPDGCANVGDCPEGGGIRFRAVNVSLAEALWQDENFAIGHTSEAGRIILNVRRHLFLRTMTIYVSVILVAFLTQLMRVQTAHELLPGSLGLLAAMWGIRGLLIPPNVHVFPTIVDYIVLLGFGVVFLILSFKLPGLEVSK
jgi:hypothetical protein